MSLVSLVRRFIGFRFMQWFRFSGLSVLDIVFLYIICIHCNILYFSLILDTSQRVSCFIARPFLLTAPTNLRAIKTAVKEMSSDECISYILQK